MTGCASVELDSLDGLAQLYLDMQDEMSRVKREVQSLRQEKIDLGRVVEDLRTEVRELRGERLEGKQVGKEEWNLVNRGGMKFSLKKQRKNQVAVKNAFSALHDECEGREEIGVMESAKSGNPDVRPGVLRSAKKVGSGRVRSHSGGRGLYVVGDSQVRYLDDRVLLSDVRKHVCLPGAGIGRVLDRIENIMEDKGSDPIAVCLSAGGNDVGKRRSVELMKQYREVLEKIKSKGGVSVVCGVLPRRGVSREWLSRAIGINCSLDKYCSDHAIPFIDVWHRFYGNDVMYARDGVHLSRQGVAVLARAVDSVVAGFPLAS